jgi:hypothetical protein
MDTLETIDHVDATLHYLVPIVKTRRRLTPPSETISSLNLQYFPGLGRGHDRRRSSPPDHACFRPEISTMTTVQRGVTVRRVFLAQHRRGFFAPPLEPLLRESGVSAGFHH